MAVELPIRLHRHADDYSYTRMQALFDWLWANGVSIERTAEWYFDIVFHDQATYVQFNLIWGPDDRDTDPEFRHTA
jgi:hypothetical protein